MLLNDQLFPALPSGLAIFRRGLPAGILAVTIIGWALALIGILGSPFKLSGGEGSTRMSRLLIVALITVPLIAATAFALPYWIFGRLGWSSPLWYMGWGVLLMGGVLLAALAFIPGVKAVRKDADLVRDVVLGVGAFEGFVFWFASGAGG